MPDAELFKEALTNSITQKLLDGWSVIPLEGKKPPPGFVWRQFQRQRPSLEHITAWFRSGTLQSYAVICGQASGGLFVIDFDDPLMYTEFAALFPTLAATRTTATRRGVHVYLRTDVTVKSRRIRDGDLKGEGSYVVGAGSVVDGFHYKELRSDPVRTITGDVLAGLLVWLSPPPSPDVTSVVSVSAASVIPSANVRARIIQRYHDLTPINGRNNALYAAAVLARRSGLSQDDTLAILLPLHIDQPPIGQHPTETADQRERETLTTIASAYRGVLSPTSQSRATLSHSRPPTDCLPNSVHEALLAISESSIPGRLLSALYLDGQQGKDGLSAKQITACAHKYRIARSSVMRVLCGDEFYVKGTPLLPTQAPPVGETQNRGLKSSKGRGRAQRFVYRVPTVEELCQRLGVKALSAAPMQPGDLYSCKTYRQALHRNLITRRPQNSLKFMADRLSVCPQTIFNYNRDERIIITPVLGYVPLTWNNVDDDSLYSDVCIRDSETGCKITPGCWLQAKTKEGEVKRYPSLRGIACRLLKQGVEVLACKQLTSYYTLPEAENAERSAQGAIWRRLDQLEPDWRGDPLDFPQIAPTLTPISRPQPRPQIEAKRVGQGETSKPLPAPSPVSSPLPEEDIGRVPGIGRRRRRELHKAGIATLEQLVEADAEQLVERFWWDKYVSLRTIQRWIDAALLLLERREKRPEEIALENWRRQRDLLRRCEDYVDRVAAHEGWIFGSAAKFGWWGRAREQIQRFCSCQDVVEFDLLAAQLRSDLEDYRVRLERFLAMSDAELEQDAFGDRRDWARLHRSTLRWLVQFVPINRDICHNA